MIEGERTVNGEYYVAPIINEAIADGKKWGVFYVNKMWGLGTPEDLQVYLKSQKHCVAEV
jgi:hypothetical protein